MSSNIKASTAIDVFRTATLVETLNDIINIRKEVVDFISNSLSILI